MPVGRRTRVFVFRAGGEHKVTLRYGNGPATLAIDKREIAFAWAAAGDGIDVSLDGIKSRVAAVVENLDYPGRSPPRRQPIAEMAIVILRLTTLTLLLNLLALPVYLLIPGINLFLFLVLNGYLFVRGYFEVVAFRRLDAGEVRAVRSRFAGRIFLGGVVIAGLFALPLVNLVAPVIATVFMLHIFEALPRVEPHP